jgi:thiamine biosynthesis lipoprotein
MRFACFGGACEVRVADRAAAEAARDRLMDLHARFTRFDPDSELERLNADPRAAVPASPEMRALARAVRRAGERTGGLVDGTLAGEIAAAGYAGATPPPNLPPELALRLAPPRRPASPAPEARWRTVSAGIGAVHRPPGVALDGGGLAKGLFADLIADELDAHPQFVVACAGDLRIRSAEPRDVHVADPFSGAIVHTLSLTDAGVATSGITRRAWLGADGRPAHHLLDPATGRPAYTGVAQVTAVAPTALEAEMLAKAALLSGPAAAPSWLPHGGVVVRDDGSHAAYVGTGSRPSASAAA